MYTVIGSTQSNLVRAAADLHDRLSNFLEDPDNTRPWLVPGYDRHLFKSSSNLKKDRYYLREFVWRLFNFYTWGRIAQDAINSLPIELMREREDLKRLYTFITLANALMTYTWLFRDAEGYEVRSQELHLFTGNLKQLTELGVGIRQQNNGDLTRASFNEAYDGSESSLRALRTLLVAMYAEESELEGPNRQTAFLIARLAALRAALAAYLCVDHDWALALDRSIAEELEVDLEYARSLAPDQKNLPLLVKRNFGELVKRYRCEWLPVDELTSSPENSGPNEIES